MATIHVLVADDQTMMRRLLVQQLDMQDDIQVVGEAANGRQAVQLVDKLRPDVVVMDLDMPLVNGLEATERIIAKYPHIKIIILSALVDLAHMGKPAGAFACLDKGSTPAELVDAIRRAHAFKGRSAPEEKDTSHYQQAISRIAMRAGLTDREKSILEKVVATDLTMEQIARALSTERKDKVSHAAAKRTLERVMDKLNIEPRTRATLVRYVLEFERDVE